MSHRPAVKGAHLTLEQAATRLGVSRQELSDRAGDGEIPGAVLGLKGWAFPAHTIEVMAAAHQEGRGR